MNIIHYPVRRLLRIPAPNTGGWKVEDRVDLSVSEDEILMESGITWGRIPEGMAATPEEVSEVIQRNIDRQTRRDNIQKYVFS